MFEANRRWIYFYDFHLTSFPKEAPKFNIKDVMNELMAKVITKEAVHRYRNDEITIRIAQMKIIDDAAYLLIHLADIKAADPAFSNTETGDVRVADKGENEGIGVACHVVINLNPIDNKTNRFLTTIEEVRGIPRSQIQEFLTAIMKKHCARDYYESEHDTKVKSSRPILKLAAHGGKNLRETIEKGELRGITLLKSNEGVYFDDDKELEISENSIKLKNLGARMGGAAVDLVKKITLQAKAAKYTQIKVVYSEVIDTKITKNSDGTTKKKETKKQQTVNIDPRSANLSDDLFTKSEPITLKKEIGQCEKSIHTELSSAMFKLLKSAGH